MSAIREVTRDRWRKEGRTWSARIGLGALGVHTLLAAGCGGGDKGSVTSPPPVDPVLVIVAPATIAVGGILQASASITPTKPVTWSSETPNLASVSSDGKITGVAPGEASIRATSGRVSQTASVTVLEPFTDLVLGSLHACAVTAAGLRYCWGYNGTSQLGMMANTDTCTPHGFTEACSTLPRLDQSSMRFVQLSASFGNTCGLTSAGEAYCWGDNEQGQLGPTSGRCNDKPCTSAPVRAPGTTHFVSIGAGDSHACALDTAGLAYCWGISWYGNLGAVPQDRCSVNSCSLAPLAVAGGLTFQALSVGDLHSCGLSPSGEAYCWGWNANGQLGNGKVSALEGGEAMPVAVGGGFSSFAVISAGRSHTCALTAAGQAYCWGKNETGQLGTGTTTSSSLPLPVVGGLTFVSITEGDDHTCALTTAGRAYCWGINGDGRPNSGQLGDGTSTSRHAPTPVARSIVFAELRAHRNFTCGRTASGSTYCWGSNLYGQLGIWDAVRTNSLSPVGVAGIP
ncbi:MAG: Ig-like domain-containing protein [Gemmatimonadaceae bacterium]